MKKTIGAFMMVAALATSCIEAEKPQKYEANWDSLKKYEVPEWWKNAKFGIYFHWGPYSVPAHKTEWYSHWMYEEGNKIRE